MEMCSVLDKMQMPRPFPPVILIQGVQQHLGIRTCYLLPIVPVTTASRDAALALAIGLGLGLEPSHLPLAADLL